MASDRELAELRSAIDRADQLYYVAGNTARLSNDEYEAMKTRLRQLAPGDERLSRVGPPYSEEDLRNKEEHRMPMGSLDNTDGGIAGFAKWYDNLCNQLGVESVEVICSLKMDGVSAGADYDGGSLSRVLSRGEGRVGDNITSNGVRWIGLPTTLPINADITVRGEVLLYNADFDKLNESGEHANPRNLCNGIIGRNSGEDNEHLVFRAFNMHGGSFKSLSSRYKALSVMGFNPVDYAICSGTRDEIVGAVTRFHRRLESKENGGDGKREDLAFAIDGIVVAVNDLELQAKLETDEKSKLRPKHSRAVKFVTFKNTTKVIGCVITLGHTGALIPTAKLEPVQIGGVTVDSALLNNWNVDSTQPSAAHVAVGDTVEVELAGDIIPKLTKVITAPKNRVPIGEPTEWNGKPTTRVRRGKATAVTYAQLDDDSPEIRKQKLKHYIGSSKKGVGILGVGDGVLSALVETTTEKYGTDANGNDLPLVRTPADLYRLEHSDLVNLAIGVNASGGPIRFGAKRTADLLREIEKAKNLPLHKFLGSLGVDLLGRRRVQILAEQCELYTLDDWLNEEKLQVIPGDVTRKSIIDGLKSVRPLIDELLAVGVVAGASSTPSVVATPAHATAKPTDGKPGEVSESNGSLRGVSICFTGTRELQDEAELAGAIVKSGISKGLNVLVQKDATSSSSKTKKAESYGTKIISVDFLRRVLDGEAELNLSAVKD